MPRLIEILLFVALVIEAVLSQIVYPENFETDKTQENSDGRTPLYAPTRCGHDELLYPGNQVDDWICDCAPTSVYHPESDGCYPVFRQGPCAPGHMIILRPNEIIPECVENACRVDGKIQIQNVCYEFGRSAPCKNPHLSFVLGVDPDTLQVDCVKLSIQLATRFADEEQSPYDLKKVSLCARGCKRAYQKLCTPKP